MRVGQPICIDNYLYTAERVLEFFPNSPISKTSQASFLLISTVQSVHKKPNELVHLLQSGGERGVKVDDH